MTILRVERSDKQEDTDYFRKADIGKKFLTTNIFGGDNRTQPGDWMEIDATVPNQPVIRSNMQWGKGNYREARGAAVVDCRGTMFGKLYDCWGYNQTPRLIDAEPGKGKRGDVWERAPWADLRKVQAHVGYPCLISEMPPTRVYCDVDMPDTHHGGTIIDSYAHHRDGKEGINGHIWAPYSKLLNIQFQLNWGARHPDNPNGHAWGWSGIKGELFRALIHGQRVSVGWKYETLDGNRFPFFSFCALDGGHSGAEYVPWPIDSPVDVDLFWQWVIREWEFVSAQIRHGGKECREAFERVTLERLKQSACDGIHLVTEYLGPSTGEVRFNDARILVGWEVSAMRAADESTEQPTEQPTAPEKPDKPTVELIGSEWTADEDGRIHRHGELVSTDELLEYLNS